ncbi:Glycoside hydrolase, family 29, subgroup [Rhodopirellula maiorica SM1]|uniref:alpha-L-fucosidase n=1 Tax=Rhodopirellula maiorica SM1 TaxID=1265738 RepID=M5RHJ3_9BACT|nr:Glycoside hydrolase, family 29, subgroup [Rhodopirellula maiorica SM1]
MRMIRQSISSVVLCGALAVGSLGPSAPVSAADPMAPHPKVAEAIEQIDAQINEGPFAATWESLEKVEIPQWYKDAKFGIFVHWGVYSVPAFGSEWYPRQMYIDTKRRGDNFYQHHIDTYGPQSKFGYKDFIPKFKAEKFDPDAWADLFQQAGAKYVVPVAEHHDGFPMYDCGFTEWDATEMGPKRDIIGELGSAIRSRGLRLGLSSHRAFNWKYYVRRPNFDNADPKYAGLYGRPMPFLFKDDAADYQSRFEPQDEQFKEDWLARTCEIVDKYNPDLIWFDFGITANQDTHYSDNHYSAYLQRFAAYYYNVTSDREGPLGIINYKWQAFPEGAAVLDLERSKMDAIRVPFWQTDTAISSSSWGYTENQKYKSAGRLVDDLVDIVSKNGCLLLNVGPRADGTIPEKDREILLSIGDWLRVNGEAIYGTTYWKTYGEGPTKTTTGHLAEHKDQPFTSQDIRFTRKGESLFAILLDWPESGRVSIKSLADQAGNESVEVRSIKLLGSQSAIGWQRDAQGLHVDLPASKPCEFAYVLKIN